VSRALGAAVIALTAVGAAAPVHAPGRAFAVTAVSPTGGTLATVTPTFAWSVTDIPPGGAPVSYRLIVGRDSTLTPPVLDTTLVDAQVQTPTRALLPGRLFWRVDARATGGATATTNLIGPIVIPPWAVLTTLSTTGGTVTFDAQPTFTWTPAAVASPPGPFTYDLFVRRVGEAFDDLGIAGLTQTQFTVTAPLERSVSYTWSLLVHAGPDTSRVNSAGAFLVADPSTPPATLLYQNFPNPFPGAGRDSTCLWFDLASASLVELDVLDLRGALVRRFIPGPDFPAILTAGRYGRSVISGGGLCDPRLMWDGRAANGREVPPGVYLYRLRAGGGVQFKRIVFRGRRP
jgi:hypothetical protein